MIQLSEVTKAFGVRTLLDRVTWQIGDGDRVGLCGPNGAGKTTLLKMLAGFEDPDAGVIAKPAGLTIGYLPQDGLTHAGRTVFEEAASAFQPLLDMKTEMTDIEHRLADPSLPEAEHDGLLSRYADLQDRFRLGDGYSMDLRIATVLRGLGFSADDADRPGRDLLGRLADAHRAGEAAAGPAEPAAARRAHQPPRPRRPQLARGVPGRLPLRRHPGLARPLLPGRGGDPHHRPATCGR